LDFEAIDGFVVIRENQRKGLKQISSVNTINVQNLLEIIGTKIIFSNTLDTPFI
jgi:hypothetical protein